jgi:hypothetical protein
MTRSLALLFAGLCAAVAVTSACLAQKSESLIAFTIRGGPAPQNPHLTLVSNYSHDDSTWSRSFSPGELRGLDPASLAARDYVPIAFRLDRPAGSLSCDGRARLSRGAGDCRFAANAAFNHLLEGKGYRTPTERQSFTLAMSNFRPDVLDALAEAGYRKTDVDGLASLGIFEIRPDFIRGLAAAGYRLGEVDELVSFRIHKVTPQLIAAYKALGYSKIEADDLTAMAIHGVTPAYIRSFAELGYRNLPAEKLVEMKIFGVTPELVRSIEADRGERPSPDALVKLSMFGRSGD